MHIIIKNYRKITPHLILRCHLTHGTWHRYITLAPNSTILGIETSCDDTGCAVITGNGNILGESLFSQHVTHLRYGGINPLVARDLHRDNIELAVNEALNKANLKLNDIDAVAVTVRPGLLISLQIGVKYAIYVSRTYKKPIIPIHHMEAHALVARMFHRINFPFLTLLISGGHSLLAVAKDVDDFLLLGETLDNAPGEILEKAARRMKLRNIPEYSKIAGGRAIQLAAQKSTSSQLFDFPLPLSRYRDCNFSFSGLKDAVIRHLVKKEAEHMIKGDEIIPEINDLCASFQFAVAEHLAHRTERAILFCEKNKLLLQDHKSIIVSGGVACNDLIFKFIEYVGSKYGCDVYRPPPKVCTDNGIMIAWNGVEKLRKHSSFKTLTLDDIDPIAPLGTNIIDQVKAANISVRRCRKIHLS